ncbi:MAG: OmpA family protein [Flavobacteriaceae bacterium]|jgi:chemotaxis protein MotB|nr:OmpA family protein [Flavobacteriaceae bacterium]MDG1911566.1 OmpA family protein [Flavobacteriaceae bacterium]
MKKRSFLVLLTIVLTASSCVSTKVFNDLESRYAILKMERNALEKSKDSIQQAWNILDGKWQETEGYLKRSRDSVSNALEQLKTLRKEYALLEQNSDQKIQESIGSNNALLKEIAIKEAQLLARSERVDQLEQLMSEQKQALLELKQRLTDALLNFEGKGLTVEQRNGKVYVSMENKLLFKSGSWNVGGEGQKALSQLGTVLAENPDIVVMIEGHTDNVPFSPKEALESNWDLSTKRATAVVNILLKNDLILPQNLTAAGRSEYVPVAPNSDAMGRAANRRIEVILSPQWDEINALLNN